MYKYNLINYAIYYMYFFKLSHLILVDKGVHYIPRELLGIFRIFRIFHKYY